MSNEYQKWAYEPPHRWIYRRQTGHRPDPRVMGDAGPWIKHVTTMWHALADPTGGHSYPAAPPDLEGTWPGHPAIAYWAPLPHLLRHSFGWRSPSWHPGWNREETHHMALGLHRLLEGGSGSAERDPRVRFLFAAWGEDHLAAFANWASGHYPESPGGYERLSYAVRALVEGGHDPLHLGAHWDAPLEPVAAAQQTGRTGELQFFEKHPPGEPRQGLLLLDTYAAWSAQLHGFGHQLEHGQWDIDVVVQPVGWLGTFRRSDDTGLWFSGDHQLHLLGHH